MTDLVPELTVRQFALWTWLPFAAGVLFGFLPARAQARRYKRLLDEACGVLMTFPEIQERVYGGGQDS